VAAKVCLGCIGIGIGWGFFLKGGKIFAVLPLGNAPYFLFVLHKKFLLFGLVTVLRPDEVFMRKKNAFPLLEKSAKKASRFY
jgi:hypothetical protein